MMVIYIIFEFMRRPWEGKEVELERILELMQNQVIEGDISKYNFSDRGGMTMQEHEMINVMNQTVIN